MGDSPADQAARHQSVPRFTERGGGRIFGITRYRAPASIHRRYTNEFACRRDTEVYPALFTCSALALGDREQKEGANNHCSGEQSGSKTPAVAIGSALGEPRPIDREMRRHKRDEAVGYPRVESAPLVTVPSQYFQSLPATAARDQPVSHEQTGADHHAEAQVEEQV